MSCLSSKFLTIGFALGTVVLASKGVAADPIRTLFLESCSTREAPDNAAATTDPWVDLFCQREADLRLARFSVAPTERQRRMVAENCGLQEMLGHWQAVETHGRDLAAVRRAVTQACSAKIERLFGGEATSAARGMRASGKAGMPSRATILGGAGTLDDDIGRSADVSIGQDDYQ